MGNKSLSKKSARQPKITTVVNKLELKSEFEDNRSQSQKLTDQETGRLGEQFVFEELKQVYETQYSASIIETDTGFQINDIELIWKNKHSESYSNYDFLITKQSKIIQDNKLQTKIISNLIEVKSTTTGECPSETIPFYLSKNEWQLMCNTDKAYYIARVFNVRNSSRFMRLIKLETTELGNI